MTFLRHDPVRQPARCQGFQQRQGQERREYSQNRAGRHPVHRRERLYQRLWRRQRSQVQLKYGFAGPLEGRVHATSAPSSALQRADVGQEPRTGDGTDGSLRVQRTPIRPSWPSSRALGPGETGRPEQDQPIIDSFRAARCRYGLRRGKFKGDLTPMSVPTHRRCSCARTGGQSSLSSPQRRGRAILGVPNLPD